MTLALTSAPTESPDFDSPFHDVFERGRPVGIRAEERIAVDDLGVEVLVADLITNLRHPAGDFDPQSPFQLSPSQRSSSHAHGRLCGPMNGRHLDSSEYRDST